MGTFRVDSHLAATERGRALCENCKMPETTVTLPEARRGTPHASHARTASDGPRLLWRRQPTPVDHVNGNGDGACPRHVAVMMDGNHRWARRRRLPGAAGHRAGARNLKSVAQACAERGVEYLTLFAFSTENWNRPKREVNQLLDLMRGVLNDDIEELNAENVRLHFIGDRGRFPADLRALMQRAEDLTRGNDKLHLIIAANFGGRWDIAQAARRLAHAVRSGELDPEGITEECFAEFLSLGSLPPPDLCIRTGGERRISNFLLWDCAYTEFYFTDVFWPDFDDDCLALAFEDYASRHRRFGSRLGPGGRRIA